MLLDMYAYALHVRHTSYIRLQHTRLHRTINRQAASLCRATPPPPNASPRESRPAGRSAPGRRTRVVRRL